MVLVDSSVWIEALRRQGKIEVKVALEYLLDAYEAQWCSPVRLEVLGGARSEERHRLGVQFSTIPYRRITEKDWDQALRIAWLIRERGITVPWTDLLIAAIAVNDTNRLYTLDHHFRKIAETPGIALHLYEPGYGGMFAPGS